MAKEIENILLTYNSVCEIINNWPTWKKEIVTKDICEKIEIKSNKNSINNKQK